MKPQSFKTEPWSKFDRQPYFFLSEQFPHEKLFIAKINQKVDKSTLNLKSTLDRKQTGLKHTDDLKFWFNPIAGKTIYMRIKQDYLKLHYDHGIVEPIQDHRYNFYTSLQSNRKLNNLAVKFGACFISDTILCNNRIKLDNIDEDFKKAQLIYYHKSSYLKNNWKLALFAAYNITKRTLLNNAILLSYKNQKAQYFLRAHNDDKWRDTNKDNKQQNIKNNKYQNYFSNLTFDYVRNINQNLKLALETDFTPEGFNGFALALEKNYPDDNAIVKFRLQSKFNAAISLKRKLGSYGFASVGMQVKDIGNTNDIVHGVQIELNL